MKIASVGVNDALEIGNDGGLDGLSLKVAAFINGVQAAIGDGNITASEMYSLTLSLLTIVVKGLEAVPTAGHMRKEWAMRAVEALFDSVADKMVPAPLWPVWLLVKPAARGLLLMAADGMIEALVPYIRSRSWA